MPGRLYNIIKLYKDERKKAAGVPLPFGCLLGFACGEVQVVETVILPFSGFTEMLLLQRALSP